MKICLVTEEYIPPVKRFSLTLKIAEVLSRENEVHLVAISFDRDYKPKGLILHSVNLPNHDEFNLKQRALANIILSYKVWEVCRKEKIDVVYGWWPVAYFASIFSGTPMVADMPEFLEKMYKTFKKKFPMIIGPILRNFQIIVAKRSKAIITESKEAKEEWVKRGIKSSKLHYRPYGIEVDFFNSQMNVSRIKKKLGVPKKELLVMYHGDIGHDDGVDILLRACKEVDLWCVVIGDGPEDYIRSLKKIAGKKTIFTGWINYSEIPAYLKNCDIYAAPFRSSEYTNTTYPLKQMEAMAAGKAVICSRLKAFSSTVEHKKDIFLVKPGKIEELKIAIKTLADNKKLRLKLGKNAHQTAIKKFGWEKRVKVDIGVIKEIYNLEIRK